MVSRIVVGSLVFLFLLGVFIYFRIEMKYSMVARNQQGQLRDQIQLELKGKTLVSEKLNLLGKLIQVRNIKFARDYNDFEAALIGSCDPSCLTEPQFYKVFELLLNSIVIKKMWVVTENRTKDDFAFYLQKKETEELRSSLSQRRLWFVDRYKDAYVQQYRPQLSQLIKMIDIKYVELSGK